MSGTKSVLLLSVLLARTFSSVAHAGPWKNEWGSLFQTGPAAVSSAQGGTIEATVFAPLGEAFSSKRHRLSFEVVDSLPKGQEVLIEPDFSEDRLQFRIKVTKQLTEKPAHLAVQILPLLSLAGGYQKSLDLMTGPDRELARHNLEAIFQSKTGTQVSEYSLLELLYNLEAGSPSAKERWTHRKALWLESLTAPQVLTQALAQFTGENSTVIEQEISRLQSEELAKTKADLPRLQKESKAFQAQQERLWDQWKKESQAFEKLEAMELKLNDLIVRNDRKGVRRLIETYLPWPLMEPAEAKTWKSWLEAIEFPRADKTTVAFRGVDYKTDFIQRLETPEGTKIGFMSTLLTKNQGSYTRRLRSLSTKRLENADDDSAILKKTGSHHRIADQMSRHSVNPIGSVFLSFTPSPAVAFGFIGETKFLPADSLDAKPFAGGGLLAVQMDSRRLLPNLPSRHIAEFEYLTPLVVFPDEIVKYEEFEMHKVDDHFTRFVKEVSDKTGRTFSAEFGLTTPEITTNYYKDGINFWKEMQESTRHGGATACSKVFN